MSSPAARFSSVDLPQPDGPVSATNSPELIVRSTPRRARTGAFSASKVLRTPRICKASMVPLIVDPSRFSIKFRPAVTSPCQLEGNNWRVTPLHQLRRQWHHAHWGGECLCRRLGDDGLASVGKLLQPLREINGVPDQRVLKSLSRAE